MPLYRNRAVALLAMLAMALQALWPLVAQAKPNVRGVQVPVCTIDGITHYVELPAPDSPVEKSSATHHEHCKMCAFGAEKLAVAQSIEAPLALWFCPEAAHPLTAVSFHPSAVDRPALPRAPPVAS